MATWGIWEVVSAHAVARPDSTALRGEAWSLTYASLRDAVLDTPTVDQSVDLVLADRAGAAVAAVLAAQRNRRPAALIPEAAGVGYRQSIRDSLATAASMGGPIAPADEGIITATSGSTGVPKLVLHDPQGIDRFTAWVIDRFKLDASTISMVCSPMNFDVSLFDVWAVLRAGGTAAFADAETVANASALVKQASQQKVTLIQAVPAVLTRLVATGLTLPAVETVVSTGDFFPTEKIDALRETFPNAELVSIYGSTETNDTFINDIGSAAEGFIGETIAGVRARVEPASEPGTGTLHVLSPFQAIGYLNASNEAWTTSGEQRWFDTGDIVEETPRGLRLLGRSDRVAKINGNRVSLDDVEAVARIHPAVSSAIAVLHHAESKRLEVVVQLAPEASLSKLALRTWMAQRLPRAALPARLWIMRAPFPLTSTGKVDRNATHRHALREEQNA